MRSLLPYEGVLRSTLAIPARQPVWRNFAAPLAAAVTLRLRVHAVPQTQRAHSGSRTARPRSLACQPAARRAAPCRAAMPRRCRAHGSLP
jgi:hypothetical protein